MADVLGRQDVQPKTEDDLTRVDGQPDSDGRPTAMATQAVVEPKRDWPDPTLEMLDSPEFEAVWQCIKSWDINVPDAYIGYCSATGNHVRAIVDAIRHVGLIAAAPDLLAALKECSFRLATLVAASGDFSDANAKALDQSVTAIAKAECR